MTSYFKTILRSLKRNIAKIVSVTMIILFGIAFVAGLGTLSHTIENSFADYLSKNNIADVIIKSKAETGFTSEEIASITSNSLVKDFQKTTVIDQKRDDEYVRLNIMPEAGYTINELSIIEGRYPENTQEIVVLRKDALGKDYQINDTLTLYNQKLKITGIVSSPLIYAKDGEPTLLDEEGKTKLNTIVYAHYSFMNGLLPVTDINIKLSNQDDFAYYTKDYKNYVNKTIDSFKTSFGDDYAYLSLEENRSYMILKSYCEK